MDPILEKEINDAIVKSLPAHVSKTLQSELEKIPRLTEKIEEFQHLNDSQKDRIEELTKKQSEYDSLNSIKIALENREKELLEKETQHEIDKLKYQLESEKDKTQFSKDVALGLVRNTNYRKTIYDNELTDGYPLNNGNYMPPKTVTKSYSEDNTEL